MATQVRGAARRVQLLDQLVDLLLAEGFAHLTLGDIAARLRCSRSTLYSLATSKDDLVRIGVVHFFRDATQRIEWSVEGVCGARDRICSYLEAVGRQLRPASPAFMADLARSAVMRPVYERNTAIAAHRVRNLVTEGVNSGEFRETHAVFVADVIAATMVRIQRGQVTEATGMTDAQAYDELATFVTNSLVL